MKNTIHLKYILVFCILSGMIFNACKTQKTLATKGFRNDYFGISGQKCVEIVSPDAIDSYVGKIECKNISFTFDYGLYSNPGPLTPTEEFVRSFDTYHHIKFFEDRMIDPKVYKIFLDSVNVVDVRKKIESDKLMFKCDPCNTTAELKFLGDTYYYPLTLSENQLNMKGFTVSYEEKNEDIYKFYKEENGKQGLFLSPKKNRYKKKSTLSLVVSTTSLSKDEIHKVLQNVYLIK